MSEGVRLNLFRSEEALSRRYGGKVIICGATLEETLEKASIKIGEEVFELRSPGGATIDSIDLLRDWDALVTVTKDQIDSESALSSPRMLVDGDGQFESHSNAHSPHSTLSTSSSIPDLQEKADRTSGPTTATTSPPSSSSSVTKTPEHGGDFSLRVTALAPTPDATSRNDWVRLNMGGKIFATTRATLTSDPTSMLARMFKSGWCSATDSTGAFLIDRSPEYFEPLLNFLRHNKLILNEGINPQGVLEEAKFFGISKAIEPLESLVQAEDLALNGRFTRKEFLRMLSITSSSSILRCQGMNLDGVDLSDLDLRNINFKCTSLSGCNLSNCDLTNCVFERADLSKSNLDGAVIQCVRMPRANLEGATLRGCVMDARMGIHTNLEGANLKGVILDNSQMNGVNLRLASLKGASLRSCNLRYAIMAGTDLENCDLTGCELQHANLRGSNLAGAVLKDIIGPLHMSQTVNVTTSTSVQGGGQDQSVNGADNQQQQQLNPLPPPPPLRVNGDGNQDNRQELMQNAQNHHSNS